MGERADGRDEARDWHRAQLARALIRIDHDVRWRETSGNTGSCYERTTKWTLQGCSARTNSERTASELGSTATANKAKRERREKRVAMAQHVNSESENIAPRTCGIAAGAHSASQLIWPVGEARERSSCVSTTCHCVYACMCGRASHVRAAVALAAALANNVCCARIRVSTHHRGTTPLLSAETWRAAGRRARLVNASPNACGSDVMARQASSGAEERERTGHGDKSPITFTPTHVSAHTEQRSHNCRRA